MVKKVVKQKDKDFKYSVINIKIQSTTEATSKQYLELFTNAFNRKLLGHIRGESYGIIRQLFTNKKEGFIYGELCSFIKIGEQAFNYKKMEIIDFQIPKEIFPNPKEADFVFFPSVHRLAIRNNAKIGLNSIILMMKDILQKVIDPDSEISITIEQSSDGFQRILNAPHIVSLHIEVSPSNGDINKDYTDFFDKELKSMHAEKMVVDIRPNAKGSLVFETSQVLQGMLGVSQSNGFAKATIINEKDKKEHICTIDYPKQFIVRTPDIGQSRDELFKQLKVNFKNDN